MDARAGPGASDAGGAELASHVPSRRPVQALLASSSQKPLAQLPHVLWPSAAPVQAVLTSQLDRRVHAARRNVGGTRHHRGGGDGNSRGRHEQQHVAVGLVTPQLTRTGTTFLKVSGRAGSTPNGRGRRSCRYELRGHACVSTKHCRGNAADMSALAQPETLWVVRGSRAGSLERTFGVWAMSQSEMSWLNTVASRKAARAPCTAGVSGAGQAESRGLGGW